MTIHRLAHKLTVSYFSVILSVLSCQLAPKSNSHISQSFVVSVYKPAFFPMLFSSILSSILSSTLCSNVIQISTRINSSSVLYVHPRLFHSKHIQYSTIAMLNVLCVGVYWLEKLSDHIFGLARKSKTQKPYVFGNCSKSLSGEINESPHPV